VSRTVQLSHLGGQIINKRAIHSDHRGVGSCDNLIRIPHDEISNRTAWQSVKNEDEAVALANDSDFGLRGSVFAWDVARGKRVASRVDTGTMFVNHPTWTKPDLPFGGIKDSGRESTRRYRHGLSVPVTE